MKLPIRIAPLSLSLTVALLGCSGTSSGEAEIASSTTNKPATTAPTTTAPPKVRAIDQPRFLEMLYKEMSTKVQLPPTSEDLAWEQALETCDVVDAGGSVEDVLQIIDSRAATAPDWREGFKRISWLAVEYVCPEHSAMWPDLVRASSTVPRAIGEQEFYSQMDKKMPNEKATLQDGVDLFAWGTTSWELVLTYCALLDVGLTPRALFSAVSTAIDADPALKSNPMTYDLHYGIFMLSMTQVCPEYRDELQQFVNEVAAEQ